MEHKKPVWLKTTDKEVESLVIKLASQGNTNEKIGLILRDQYGIPTTKIYGKRISQILKENKIDKDPDLENLKKRVDNLKKHAENNKQDKATKKALSIKEAKIKKLLQYRKKE